MANRRGRRRRPPRRGLIAPLVMLVSGMAAGVLLWRFLMLDDARVGEGPEQLSRHDRQALQRLLDEGRTRP